jgi:hypothetical protein
MLSLAMGRATASTDFVRDFSASHRFILDYLMDEVMGGLDDEDRLRRFVRMNLFLIKLDGEGRWFQELSFLQLLEGSFLDECFRLRTGYSIRAEFTGNRAETHPTEFTSIQMNLEIKSPDSTDQEVEACIAQAETALSPVLVMLSKVVGIDIGYIIKRSDI